MPFFLLRCLFRKKRRQDISTENAAEFPEQEKEQDSPPPYREFPGDSLCESFEELRANNGTSGRTPSYKARDRYRDQHPVSPEDGLRYSTARPATRYSPGILNPATRHIPDRQSNIQFSQQHSPSSNPRNKPNNPKPPTPTTSTNTPSPPNTSTNLSLPQHSWMNATCQKWLRYTLPLQTGIPHTAAVVIAARFRGNGHTLFRWNEEDWKVFFWRGDEWDWSQ